MNDLRRDLWAVPEGHWEVHDIVEGVVPLRTFERSSRVLGKVVEETEEPRQPTEMTRERKRERMAMC